MGSEEHCKQMSLAGMGSACSVWVTLGLSPLTACVLSWSTLLRLQVALPGNFLGWALGCVHFPDLHHSGSWVLHKGTDSCLRFMPFPGPSSSGNQVLGESTLPRCSASYHLPGPSRWLSWVHSCISGVPCVSSGELISGCDPPDGCQLSSIPGRLG